MALRTAALVAVLALAGATAAAGQTTGVTGRIERIDAGQQVLVLSDGRVEVDSDTVERSMRPIAMGRRNSLFSGSEGGAESWPILSSMVNTAKLHELDPQAYLSDVLERIVSGQTKSPQLHELLAWNWKATRAAQAAA